MGSNADRRFEVMRVANGGYETFGTDHTGIDSIESNDNGGDRHRFMFVASDEARRFDARWKAKSICRDD
jgi:hypothetical protein